MTIRPEKGGWFFLQRRSTRSQSEAESLLELPISGGGRRRFS